MGELCLKVLSIDIQACFLQKACITGGKGIQIFWTLPTSFAPNELVAEACSIFFEQVIDSLKSKILHQNCIAQQSWIHLLHYVQLKVTDSEER